MFITQLISLAMSVGGVCMIGVFSTRGEDDHNDPMSNATISSTGDGGSQNDNTVMGVVVLDLSICDWISKKEYCITGNFRIILFAKILKIMMISKL